MPVTLNRSLAVMGIISRLGRALRLMILGYWPPQAAPRPAALLGLRFAGTFWRGHSGQSVFSSMSYYCSLSAFLINMLYGKPLFLSLLLEEKVARRAG
jgi:hypothetical protein